MISTEAYALLLLLIITALQVFNASHARWVFIDDSTGGIVDSIDIVQANHGPYTSGLHSVDGATRKAAWEAAREHAHAAAAAARAQEAKSQSAATGTAARWPNAKPLPPAPSAGALSPAAVKAIAEGNRRQLFA